MHGRVGCWGFFGCGRIGCGGFGWVSSFLKGAFVDGGGHGELDIFVRVQSYCGFGLSENVADDDRNQQRHDSL